MKWIRRVLLIIILVVVSLGVIGYFNLKSTEPPNIEDAPYLIQNYYNEGGFNIPTRYYYAEAVEVIDGKAVCSTYWTYNGEKYKKHNGEIVIDTPYKIIKRVE